MNTRLATFRHVGATDLQSQRHTVKARPAYGVFTCRDGLQLSLGALEDHFWQALVEVLDLSAWRRDAVKAYAGRMPEAQAINRSLAEALQSIDRADAVARLAAADVPVFEVLGPSELPGHEQFAERGGCTPTRRAVRCAAFRFAWRVKARPRFAPRRRRTCCEPHEGSPAALESGATRLALSQAFSPPGATR